MPAAQTAEEKSPNESARYTQSLTQNKTKTEHKKGRKKQQLSTDYYKLVLAKYIYIQIWSFLYVKTFG